ncbi:hypothetical protein Phi13:2_gp022 [Cellulophaga phage phi13:2]|uniref:Uncharacterized protein n=1 Tax=Cellulophaga phage phi13:2 TaxID=1328030 RepID=S0A5I0_9CAUD|nr:hypothetical protein Phi13:2_gp022 [Cellulophaga phage phi13:2]AGO49632.1 hypothetical protein Phi13:2_gp022 [Cellulophaga phage phi13:2]
MENMKRSDLREEVSKKGLTYSDIGSKEIGVLTRLLKEELSVFENDGFTMTLCRLRERDIEYKEDGTLKKCFFMVKGVIDGKQVHFERREAISFNTQDKEGEGFIGFAGWSDSTNVKPFLTAFYKFLNQI